MSAVLYETIVVDARTGVNYDVGADDCSGIYDRSGCDYGSCIDPYVRCQYRSRMYCCDQAVAHVEDEPRQLQPHLGIPKREDHVVNSPALKVTQNFTPSKYPTAKEVCSATLRIYVVKEAGDL